MPLTTWQTLMNQWSTDLTLPVGPDGTIDFSGFFGKYEVTVDGQTFELDPHQGRFALFAGRRARRLQRRRDRQCQRLHVWRDTLGSTDDLRADGNGDGTIDELDYDLWKSLYGTAYAQGGGQVSTAVPEPASAVLVACGLVAAAVRRAASVCRLR